MTVTVADLAQHLGFSGTPEDTEVLQRTLDSATAMLTPHLLEEVLAAPSDHQAAVLDLATLTVAGDLWRRKDAPGGMYSFADASEYPTTLPRDPVISVWPWLVAAGWVRAAVVA